MPPLATTAGPAAAARGEPPAACAIRGHPPHAPCAICDDAYGTRFVCASCRADPANADWCERSEFEVLDGDGVAPEPRQTPSEVLRADRSARLERDVLDALVNRSIRIPARVRLRRDGLRIWTWRWESRALTFREIAWLVGCSHTYVERIYYRATRR